MSVGTEEKNLFRVSTDKLGATVSRLKIMAGLDITNDEPCTGDFGVTIDGRDVQLHVAIDAKNTTLIRIELR